MTTCRAGVGGDIVRPRDFVQILLPLYVGTYLVKSKCYDEVELWRIKPMGLCREIWFLYQAAHCKTKLDFNLQIYDSVKWWSVVGVSFIGA